MPTYQREFRLGLLPEKKWNWRTFATSYGLLVCFILLILLFGVLMPAELRTNLNFHVTELIPRPSLRPEPPPPPKPLPVHAKLLPKPVPVFEAPKLIVPKEVRAPKPHVQEVEVPKVALNNFAPAVLKPIPGGARPVLIHTGDFAGSSQVPTVNAPIQKVQTGGFGDPNGLKPNENSKSNAKLMAAAAGGFDMPVGPGNGNGTGGAKGIKGTVASADFGNGIATPGKGDGRSSGKGVQTSGFGAQEVAQMKPGAHLADTGPATTSVEILYKPNPAYTEEARGLKLEGEVLLEVLFSANGTLHVNRVVRGLGHGLDENAIAAANKMRFKPAMRTGQPMDSTAIVHVVFQLAY